MLSNLLTFGSLLILCLCLQSNALDGKHQDIVWRVCWAQDDIDNYLNFYSISADGKVINWTLVKSFLWRNEKFLLGFDKTLHNIPPHCVQHLTGQLALESWVLVLSFMKVFKTRKCPQTGGSIGSVIKKQTNKMSVNTSLQTVELPSRSSQTTRASTSWEQRKATFTSAPLNK